MKLIYCEKCHDLFVLRKRMRKCACGRIRGRYVNDTEAEVSKKAVSIGIGNHQFLKAIEDMKVAMKHPELFGDHSVIDREAWINIGSIDAAWVRPNEGEGNPHTKVIKEKKG